jgi:hypothetical protein
LTRWIVALAVSGLMMALVLAGAAKAQDLAGHRQGTDGVAETTER